METKFLPPRRPAKRVPRSPARARVAGSSESDQASDTRKVTRKSSRERAPVLSPRSAALQRPSTRSTAAASEVTPQTRTRSSAPRHTSAAGCASPPSVVSGVHRTRSRSGPVVDQRSKSSLPDFTLTRKAGERPVKISKGSPSSFRELRNLALEGQPDHSALKQAAKGVNAMKTKRTPLGRTCVQASLCDSKQHSSLQLLLPAVSVFKLYKLSLWLRCCLSRSAFFLAVF